MLKLNEQPPLISTHVLLRSAVSNNISDCSDDRVPYKI